jgi:hypothetical protein
MIIGATRLTSISVATISMNDGSSISATAPRLLRRSRLTQSTGALRTARRTGPLPAYDFPAVADKRVLLEEFTINNLRLMQAFAFNTRRDKFLDPRVRLAFNYLFDFEEMNRQIFYSQYKRITSYFEGTDLASSGLPTDRERSSLAGCTAKVPAVVLRDPTPRPPVVYSLRRRWSIHCFRYERPYSHPHDRTCKEVVPFWRLRCRQFRDIGMDIVFTLIGRKITVRIIGQARHWAPPFQSLLGVKGCG